MKIIYANEALPIYRDEPLIFLAGPTPRDKSVESWRPKALKYLADIKFSGTVFIPEDKLGSYKYEYLDQVEWEYESLERCAKHGTILFWVPRNLTNMPAFTTNVEFGVYITKGRSIIYGRPRNAPKTRYLDWLYFKKHKRYPENTLCRLIKDNKDVINSSR